MNRNKILYIKTIIYSLFAVLAIYLASPSLLSQAKVEAPEAQQSTEQTTIDSNSDDITKKEETETIPAPTKQGKIGLVDLFVAGGWSMYPLLIASIVGIGIIFERIYFFSTTKLAAKGFNQDLEDAIQEGGLDGARRFLDENKNQKISSVLLGGLDVSQNDPEIFSQGVEREAGEVITLLERGLVVLAAVSTIAPLIGFLGTVSGMINAFDAIANADQVNAKVVAGGIKESLITTATGLIVAIPAMVFYQYLTSRVNAFAAIVEECANKLYKELLKKKASKVVA